MNSSEDPSSLNKSEIVEIPETVKENILNATAEVLFYGNKAAQAREAGDSKMALEFELKSDNAHNKRLKEQFALMDQGQFFAYYHG